MGGQFETIGPIEMPRDADEADIAAWFKNAVDIDFPGLASSIGIDIIATQADSGPAFPWYVGKTEAGFLKRFKQHAKLKKGFGDLTRIPPGGKLNVFFLPLTSGKKSKFRMAPKKANSIRAIRALEDMLIGSCLRANEELLNVSQKTLHRDLKVPGYLHDDDKKRTAAAKAFACMLDSI